MDWVVVILCTREIRCYSLFRRLERVVEKEGSLVDDTLVGEELLKDKASDTQHGETTVEKFGPQNI